MTNVLVGPLNNFTEDQTDSSFTPLSAPTQGAFMERFVRRSPELLAAL